MNNTITIIGHVGQNPLEKIFASGKKVVKFSVAVSEYAPVDKRSDTLWIDVQAWNELGDRVLSHITKGREVVIDGKLTLDKYTDKNGREIVKPVINLVGYHLCGKKNGTSKSQN